MAIETEEITLFGLISGGYRSTDDNGHAGYGNTREDSQNALEHSLEVDSSKSSHSVLFGWDDTPKDK
jgi:hypothetical protein